MKWDFHFTDGDDWPSSPHGHSIDPTPRYKMDIYNGGIYDKTTYRLYGKVAKKELHRLWLDEEFFTFVCKSRSYLIEKYPFRKLPLLPFGLAESLKQQQICKSYLSRDASISLSKSLIRVLVIEVRGPI